MVNAYVCFGVHGVVWMRAFPVSSIRFKAALAVISGQSASSPYR